MLPSMSGSHCMPPVPSITNVHASACRSRGSTCSAARRRGWSCCASRSRRSKPPDLDDRPPSVPCAPGRRRASRYRTSDGRRCRPRGAGCGSRPRRSRSPTLGRPLLVGGTADRLGARGREVASRRCPKCRCAVFSRRRCRPLIAGWVACRWPVHTVKGAPNVSVNGSIVTPRMSVWAREVVHSTQTIVFPLIVGSPG